MRTLVLGGSGFLGSHLVDVLLERGHEVRVFDRSHERFRQTPQGVEFQMGNFSDTAALAESLADMDQVFHFASTMVPSTSNLDPVADIEGNLVNTVRLLRLMRNSGVKRLVYLSSGGAVYGIPDASPVAEDHPLRPISSYGIVKVAIENYLYMEQHLHGLQALVLRPSNPYGPRQGHGGVQGVIGTFLRRVSRGEGLEVWGDGSVIRDFIHVEDFARLCAMGAEAGLTGVYNAGSGTGQSIRQIVEVISQVCGREVPVDYKPGRGFDVPQIVLDISAIRDHLDWQPEISLEDGIARTWDWIQKQD